MISISFHTSSLWRLGGRLPNAVFTAVSVAVAVLNAYSADSQLRPAVQATPPATHITVDINDKFSKGMATRAGLDKDNPQFSSSGVQSGETSSGQALASAECLLAETVVASKNPFSSNAIDSFCKNVKSGTSVTIDSAKSDLEEHAGKRIDDALIHVVTWNKGKADGTWYQYSRHTGKWSGKLVSFAPGDAVTSVDHILGHGNVAFLAVHLGIDDTCKISYDVEAKHTKPLNQQDVADLIQLAEAYYNKGKTPAKAQGGAATLAFDASKEPPPYWGVWGGVMLLKLPTLPASITLTPSAANASSVRAVAPDPTGWEVSTTCTKAPADGSSKSEASTSSADTPFSPLVSGAWLQNVSYVGSGAPKVELREGGPEPASTDGGQTATPSRATSGTHPTQNGSSQPPAQANGSSAKSKDPLSSLAVTVPNEGVYWWDVSVAMPVTSFNQLKYDSTNNLVVLKKTNDIKPYALFDFYPAGADLRAKNYISMFKLSAGIPMSSQPLQKPFVGTGLIIGIKSFRFQPMVGLRIEKDQRTTTLAPGSSANQAQLTDDLRYQWHAKLQVMIGFSVADARKVLGLK
jgi:hypothetical protein